jgi:hypothetical protein
VADQWIAQSPIYPQTASMLKALSPVAVLLAALALAGPAAAQDPVTDTTPAPVCTGTSETDPGTCTSAGQTGDQTVGNGQVVTDPANQVDGPTAPSDGDGASAEPKKGEQHVLGNSATASSPTKTSSAPTHTAAPAATPQPAAATTSPKTLPFTGIDAGPLVLMGTLLLGSGLMLRRRLEA